ncbi:endopeptidase La [Candidatus Gracilibacteria bacterium]|nr:endopeptidase La [Candidatus Gracilibacteria bacterium]
MASTSDKSEKPKKISKTTQIEDQIIILPPPAKGSVVLKPSSPILTVYPVVPIREGVLFPSTESVLSFGRSVSLNAIREAIRTKKMVVLLTQRRAEIDNPKAEDLYEVGTLAYIEKTLKIDSSINALVKGIKRVKVLRYTSQSPRLAASVEELKEEYVAGTESEALVAHLQKEFRRAVHMGKPVEFLNFMKLMAGVTHAELVDQIASTLSISTPDKQLLLEETNVSRRLNKVIEHLAHEMKVMEIEKDVMSKTQERFDKHMRDSVLRERLHTIQKELGEEDEEEEIVDEYERKLKKLRLTDDTREKIAKEIKRLRQMSVNNPEAGYIRTWLDTVLELPWEKAKQKTISLEKAKKILDENHYGLDDVKDRILEHIAVLQLKQKNAPVVATKPSSKRKKAPTTSGKALPTILCFVGPPGVGKTSIGQSIAQALGRDFTKVSLGGIRDEAEIRGHRRTYVGAMTGKILSGIRQAKSINPVFMLDEIDKIGSDYRGDPSAALLEALDPEQNFGFVDHYLDVPFDLSQVIFITTANTLESIPAALLDRLEIIRYAGYTDEEKFNIAKSHLISKVIKQNGLKPAMIKIPDKTIYTIIHRYTREAGVRSLERTLHSLARKVARELGTSVKKKSIAVDSKKARTYLGPEEYDMTILEHEDQVGLATGLAWTSVGGEVLFIEVALTEGKGLVKLTGKLGDVMKESAQTALTHVKANAKMYGLNIAAMNKTDVHIHFPEGAVPKDGPSAGITITTAIVSAFLKKPIRRTVAMTGEVTLRGRVLRIGGLKEKVLAALRAGCTTVLIPQENERDLEKIPKPIRKKLDFRPVSHVSQVLPQSIVGFKLLSE